MHWALRVHGPAAVRGAEDAVNALAHEVALCGLAWHAAVLATPPARPAARHASRRSSSSRAASRSTRAASRRSRLSSGRMHLLSSSRRSCRRSSRRGAPRIWRTRHGIRRHRELGRAIIRRHRELGRASIHRHWELGGHRSRRPPPPRGAWPLCWPLGSWPCLCLCWATWPLCWPLGNWPRLCWAGGASVAQQALNAGTSVLIGQVVLKPSAPAQVQQMSGLALALVLALATAAAPATPAASPCRAAALAAALAATHGRCHAAATHGRCHAAASA